MKVTKIVTERVFDPSCPVPCKVFLYFEGGSIELNEEEVEELIGKANHLGHMAMFRIMQGAYE